MNWNMNWDKLLSTQKLTNDERLPDEFEKYPINDFEQDYNKIVSSAAFRRLQDKTQVFPLDKSDFVRTRLTHSIEVSTIARQLGIMVSKNNTDYPLADVGDLEAEKIASILLCAGLLHDLGNPPFGHFGEAVIKNWFRNNLGSIYYGERALSGILTSHMIKDLENFDGNAQTLRILAKARYKSEINVSASVISTLIKYPTNSESFNDEDSDIKKRKPGYFFAERKTFEQVSEIVGTLNASGEICRHPLTYLLEAADDIAYATADLEDAFKKGLFSLNEFIEFFETYCNKEKVKTPNCAYYSQELINNLKERQQDSSKSHSQIFAEWIVLTRRWLMYCVAFCFSYGKSYAKIMRGTYKNDLFFNPNNHNMTIEILKDVMKKFVYNSPGILKLELSSQTILNFLLSGFVNAVLYYDDDEKQSAVHKKYLHIFSDNYKRDYNLSKNGDEAMNLYLRLLMVTDYISGMTDTYARTLYRELNGIE